MTYSQQNSKRARRSQKPFAIRSGSPGSPPPSWQPWVSGLMDLPSLSAIDWPGGDLAPTPPPANEWRTWLTAHFPSYVRAGFAPRHFALWEWLTAIGAFRPRPFVAIWPRGGAKSTSVELGCAWLQARQTRRFVLYVSGTQAQADGHVQSVATLLERLGVARALNRYGASRGWRQQELRTAGGFNVRAFGLDAGARGVKIDDVRPDVIVFDDVDERHDTPLTVQKKIETITQTILPAGSDHAAALFVQNRIHAGSIASMLADNAAPFLLDRLPVSEEPAVHGLTVATELQEGRTVYRVTGGTPTWDGQNRDVVEQQINTWGWDAFQREAQHVVARGGGQYFRQWREDVHTVDAPRPDISWPVWCALDYGLDHPLAWGLFTYHAALDTVYQLAEHVAGDLLIPQHVAKMNAALAEWGIARHQLRATYAGHDCWAKRDTGRPAPQSIADRFDEHGWPLTHATIDRVNGWSAIGERLGQSPDVPPRLLLDRGCVETIAIVPRLAKDPRRPDDVLKMGGDDAADMLRYGVMGTPVSGDGYGTNPTAGYRG